MPRGAGQFGALYEPKRGGTELAVVRDKFIYVKATDQANLNVITDLQGLPDATRTRLAASAGLDLTEYDQNLEDDEFVLRDRLDYYDYDTVTNQKTVADGAWFTPDSVESFCGETAPNVATRCIDGDDNTFWRHAVNETHILTFKLRNYPKKIERIRFRYGAGESARERLNDLTVKAAKGLANLDANVLESGINITWPTGAGLTWVEHTLASKKLKARYIRLEIGNTDNGQNQAQIREFQVFVTTRKPEDTDTE